MGEIPVCQLQIGELFSTESLLGTRFNSKVMQEVNDMSYSPVYPAIIPMIEGQAFLTGMHQFVFTPGDLFKERFILYGKT